MGRGNSQCEQNYIAFDMYILRWCWPISTLNSVYVSNNKEIIMQVLNKPCNTPRELRIPSVPSCYCKREFTQELNLRLLSNSFEKQKLQIMWNGSIFWHTGFLLFQSKDKSILWSVICVKYRNNSDFGQLVRGSKQLCWLKWMMISSFY